MILAVLAGAEFPTSLRRRSTSYSMFHPLYSPRTAQPAQQRCVHAFPSLTLCHPSSSIELTTGVQIVTGIISLVNDFLNATGRAKLGFLNPWLYENGPMSLNDITSGYNPGCGTDGFEANAGWDPVRSSHNTFDFSFSTLADFELHRSRVLERQTSTNC